MTRHEWALLPTPQVPTLNTGMTAAALCHANGWKAGVELAADEGFGVTRVTVTAIGRENILARRTLSGGRAPTLQLEATIQLHNLDWRKVA